jgi:trans-aconitate methyltransferase
MIGAAKEWNPGPEYNVCDGHELLSWLKENDLIGKFDKVFSNAALHWMIQSPSAVVEGMSAALKPSGTLAIEMGGSLNVIGLRSALHSSLARRGIDPVKVDPWYFPSPATYSNLIEKSGLRVNVAYLYARLTPLPNGLQGFLEVRNSTLCLYSAMLITLFLLLIDICWPFHQCTSF